MKQIVVVAALIQREGRLLVSQRENVLTGGGFWEFPGGKVDPGETPRQALAREMIEELGIRVQVGPIMDAMVVEQFEKRVTLLFYHCRMEEGQTPQPLDGVAQFLWKTPQELEPALFLPADRQMIGRIAARGDAFLAHTAALWREWEDCGSWVD